MANAREILDRMKSIQDTMKITNAMYMISSSKLRKARKMEEDAEAHFYASRQALDDVLKHVPEIEHVYIADEKDENISEPRKAFIVVTADKGLAGAYNHNIIKMALEDIEKTKNYHLFVVGKIGRDFFEKHNMKIERNFKYTIQNPSIGRARIIAETVLEHYLNGEFDEVYIVFTEMLNVMQSEVKTAKLLPINRPKAGEESSLKEDTEYVPSVEAVIDSIVPNLVTGFLYGALVEAYSSEQNSRMVAMKSSTENAGEMLKELGIEYNRVRQAAITQEITEVVAGAKAQQAKRKKQLKDGGAGN
ncbi:MAG: ATP synthase F1 subunit gamma [Lachnospiraceae bacterium]|nr:ATP synthase F1 subunit gamma [Lachnospiraceae bacterium]